MRLLAIDIGGTNSRFADCHVFDSNDQSNTDFEIKQSFNIDTAQPYIESFQDVIEQYNANKADSFLDFLNYDRIAIAVAGPVFGRQCSPPNISWDIDLDNIPALPNAVLLNDFVAQAYAFIQKEEIDKLVPIRKPEKPVKGNSAVIGAGTGLGHCLISPIDIEQNKYQVIASEAGQSGFTFNQDEHEIAAFFQKKTGQNFIINDSVVSGSGLSLIHEYLTGQQITAEGIFSDSDKNKQTLVWFSRFYGRACRNYCLSNCVTDKLIISGGLAAKHPELVNSECFFDEFENMDSHKYLLKNISIYLNNNENIGLLGACYYILNTDK